MRDGGTLLPRCVARTRAVRSSLTSTFEWEIALFSWGTYRPTPLPRQRHSTQFTAATKLLEYRGPAPFEVRMRDRLNDPVADVTVVGDRAVNRGRISLSGRVARLVGGSDHAAAVKPHMGDGAVDAFGSDDSAPASLTCGPSHLCPSERAHSGGKGCREATSPGRKEVLEGRSRAEPRQQQELGRTSHRPAPGKLEIQPQTANFSANRSAPRRFWIASTTCSASRPTAPNRPDPQVFSQGRPMK